MGFHRIEAETVTAEGVRYRTCAFPPHDATPPHEHEMPFFCLVLDGVSEQHSGSEERLRARSQVFFYPAHERQSERFGGSGGRIFVVEVPETGARLPRSSCELKGHAALLVRRLHLASRHTDDLAKLAFDDATMSLIARQDEADLRWMPIVCDYLHAHFAEKLSLASIASAAGVHPVHLCRAFPRRFGMTLGDYARALRVDHAARSLAATDRPIAEIALDAGFASQAHLTRHFRERMGVTPAAYRAAC